MRTAFHGESNGCLPQGLLRSLFILVCAVGVASAKPPIPARERASSTSSGDAQAISLASQSIAVLTGGTAVTDVTLSGTAVWTSGSDNDTGTVTLLALGSGESRMDLALSSGTRTEIRDASTGSTLGEWISPGGSGLFAAQNTATDPAWFFGPLSSLAGGGNVTFVYVGQEFFNGATTQHIQTFQPGPASTGPGPSQQTLSTMDFYLDAASLLPTAICFNAHPDSDANTNIPIEVDFSSYQSIGGIQVPTKIQRFLQGSLTLDLTITSAVVNSNLNLAAFAIN